MANFAILRTGKIKSAASAKGMLKHNFRAIDTPNADDERTADNEHLAAVSVEDGMRRYRELMPAKIRKNGVHLIDYMITTSPEASKEANAAALQEGYNWVAETYGKDKIVMASKHLDETTPHIHILVAPIDEKGKLNARHFIGGSKHRMTELQDEFHARLVDKGIKLDRGIKGSKAKHQTIKKFYSDLTATTAKVPKITAEDLKRQQLSSGKGRLWDKISDYGETPFGIAQRINEKIKTDIEGFAKEVLNTRKLRDEVRAKASEIETLKPYAFAFKKLTDNLEPSDMAKLEAQSKILRAAKEQSIKEHMAKTIETRALARAKNKDRGIGY
jgi:hypothetical protein